MPNPKSIRRALVEIIGFVAVFAGAAGLVVYHGVNALQKVDSRRVAALKAANTKTAGLLTVTTDLGCVGDGITDNHDRLQAALDRLTGPATFYFPAGNYVVYQPLIAGRFAPSFTGAGAPLTMLGTPAGTGRPVLVYGLRQVEKDQIPVSTTHRPDAFGVLDATVAPAAGAYFAYRTNGNTWAQAVAQPAQLGMQSVANPNDVGFDYYGEMTGFTLEVCLGLNNTKLGTSFRICGLGSGGENPAPFFLLSPGDGTNRLAVTFKTNGQSVDFNTPLSMFYFNVDPTASLHRIRIWFDFLIGEIGINVNGVDQQLQPSGPAPDIKNKRFLANRGQFPFSLATDADSAGVGGFTVPDLTFWGLRLSRVARKTEPTHDAERYLAQSGGQYDPDVICFLPGTGAPARYLDFDAGTAAHLTKGSAFILSANPTDGGIEGGHVSDLTFNNGAPSIMLGAVRGVQVERCRFTGFSTQSLGSLPLVAAYPIRLSDCDVQGTDAPLAFYRGVLWLNGIRVLRGGSVSARFVGCDVSWRDGIFENFSATTRAVIFALPGQYGGVLSLTNLNVDSENNGFADGVFVVETDAYTTTTFTLNDCTVSGVGSGNALVNLIGHAPQAGVYNPASVSISNLSVYTSQYDVAVKAGAGWHGTVDLSSLPKATVSGPGAATLKVITPPTFAPTNTKQTAPKKRAA